MLKNENIDDWYEKYYTPSFWSKKHENREEVLNHFLDICINKSKLIQQTTPCDLDVPYGESSKQKIDYFFSNEKKENLQDKPIFVYVHGGYWYEGGKDIYSFTSSVFTKLGYLYAVIGYDLCPDVTIEQIIVQVTKGIEHIKNTFHNSAIILIGHSAGAYLSVATSVTVPVDGVVLLSGIYDVKPLMKTSMNDALMLTEIEAEKLNLLKSTLKFSVDKILVLVGGAESAEFHRQSKEFYDFLLNKKYPTEFCIIENEDHFSIIENFLHVDFIVVEKIVKFSKKCIRM